MIADGETLGLIWLVVLLVLSVTISALRKRAGWRAPPGQRQRVLLPHTRSVMVLFAIVGPPIAFLVLGIASLVASGDWGAVPPYLVFAPLSYVFGLIPALATGAAVGRMHGGLTALGRLIMTSAAVCAAVSTLAGAVYGGLDKSPAETFTTIALFGLLGLVTGALCGSVLGWIRYLPEKAR